MVNYNPDFRLRTDLNKNYLFIPFIILSFLGVLWLVFQDISAGKLYFSLFVGLFVLFLFLTYLFREEKFVLFLPINNNITRAALMVVFGIIFGLIIFSVFSVLGGQQYTNFLTQSFAPFASFGSTNIIPKTFAATQILNDPGWYFHIVISTASIIEEIIITVFLLLIFHLLIYYLFYILKIDFGKTGNIYVSFLLALVLVVISFAGLHYFNNTYTSSTDFYVAGLFKLISASLIYFFKLGIEFGIGLHGTLNGLAIGFNAFITGLFAWQGLLLLFLLIIPIFLIIFLNIKETKKVLKHGFTEFGLGV